MKMRTYTEADYNGRRFNDSNTNHWNEGPRPTNDVPAEIDKYKTEWPEGYWELCSDLQKEALEISGAIVVHMVMLQDGMYRVYALMPNSVRLGGPMYGPEEAGRIQAWKSFIGTFAPKSILVPAGSRKLGTPNANGDVMLGAGLFEGLDLPRSKKGRGA